MPPQAVDLLIEARWVLPVAPVNTVLSRHSVAVRDGIIIALGPSDSLRSQFEPRAHVVRGRHALLPGLVNAHTQASMTVLRGLPVHGPRARWLIETVEPMEQRCSGPDFVREGTTLAIAEMLLAGVTAFADISALPEEAARVASAARVRAAIGLPVAETTSLWADNPTAYFAAAERLWDAYRADPWICLYFSPQNANDMSDETLIRVRRVADELDARIAMQVHESEPAVLDSLSLHGLRPLRRLDQLGLLRPGFSALHMNRLDEEDFSIIGRTGINVVACPQADLRLGGGSCPLQRLAGQQVTTGLGSSDPLSAGSPSMLAEAGAAVLGANGFNTGMDWLGCAEALRMATLGGATALGLAGSVGSIEPGKAADLACFDLGTGPLEYGGPAAAVPDRLLFGAISRSAADVWTAGRPMVREGQLLSFDSQELCALAQKWLRQTRLGDPA